MAPTRTTIPGSGSGRPRSRPTLVLMTEHTPGTPPRSEVTGPQRISRRQLAPASALGRHLRDAAVHVVRTDSPPTVALGVRSEGDRDISQQHARAVIDLALRVGEAMLSTGASAADSVATVLRLANAYGVGSVHVDVTYTSISVSIHRGLEEDSLTVMRVIPARSPDYTRLEGVQQLIDDIIGSAGAGGATLDVLSARERLLAVLTSPHPYRRWVVTVGSAVMSVGVVLLFGAGPVMWLVAALSAATVDRVQRLLYGLGVAAFFTQAVSAAIPATLALVLFTVEGDFVPSVVVISGIVVLLAGLGVLGAAQDALDGYYVTAGARGLEVVLMTLGIAVGVAVVIGIGTTFGISMQASAVVALGGSPVVSTVGAVLIALGFCVSTYSGLRTTVTSMITSALAWLAFEVGLEVGLSAPGAVAVAASLVGALAYAAYRRLRVPESAVATASIVALLPGLAVYRALYQIMQNTPATVPQAVVYFVGAVSTGIALAAGLAIGSFFARRRMGLDLAGQRARRRSGGSLVGG